MKALPKQPSSKTNPFHQRGFEAEDIVLQYFAGRGFILKSRRWRTPFGEIDLLLFHETLGWWIVEVKVCGDFEVIVSDRQKLRLQRAAEFVLSRLGKMPRLVVAAVNHLGSVEVLPLE